MIIHALLVSGTLPSLSLANNRKIRSKGWRIISYYVKRSPHLKYLDLSDNVIDKKMADLLGEAVSLSVGSPAVPALNETSDDKEIAADFSDQDESDPFSKRKAPLLLARNISTSGLSSLRLENCSLRNPVLESLANSVRSSGIKHISLRRNRINQLGAVALAVLIRDYELSSTETVGSNAFKHVQGGGGADGYVNSASSLSVTSPLLGSGGFPRDGYQDSHVAENVRATDHVGHQNHKSLPVQSATPELTGIYSPSSASSTSVTEMEDHETSFGPDRNEGRVTVSAREASRYAEMRTRLQKQIEVLPRVGTLLTLDIRSNDIKVSREVVLMDWLIVLTWVLPRGVSPTSARS